MSGLSEFDRIIRNDRIDVCLYVFTPALIVGLVRAARSIGLVLMTRLLGLLSVAARFHELSLALAPLAFLASLHKYCVILEEIQDRCGIQVLRRFTAVFFA